MSFLLKDAYKTKYTNLPHFSTLFFLLKKKSDYFLLPLSMSHARISFSLKPLKFIPSSCKSSCFRDFLSLRTNRTFRRLSPSFFPLLRNLFICTLAGFEKLRVELVILQRKLKFGVILWALEASLSKIEARHQELGFGLARRLSQGMSIEIEV